MLDIYDLLDYIQDDCEFDIFNCDNGATIEGLDREQLEDWASKHKYEVCSIEPIQRLEQRLYGERAVFGIVFNLSDIEDIETDEEDSEDEDL